MAKNWLPNIVGFRKKDVIWQGATKVAVSEMGIWKDRRKQVEGVWVCVCVVLHLR